SAFLNIFGNPYLSLRGISWLACITNLLLLYVLCNKFTGRLLSLGCTAFYAGLYLVNSLSIQGRGYTLAITFYLISLLMLYEICVNRKNHVIYYALFSLSLTWGLYTITSNLYWVLPTCFVGGFYLLFQKDFPRLIRLIISSVIAALHTFGLYTLIWLAIGSNLLSKTADSGFYGIYQVTIILKAPLKAFLTGMNYMLASPYVQSMDREIVIRDFFPWLTGLLDQFVISSGKLTLYLLFFFLLLHLFLAVLALLRKNRIALFFHSYASITLIMVPMILIIQSVQPYHRVFTFFGITMAITFFTPILWKGEKPTGFSCEAAKDGNFSLPKLGNLILCLLFLGFCCFNLFSSYYRAPYADRESKIKEILQQSEMAEEIDKICFLDDYQKYVLQFYYDIRPTEASLPEADFLLVPTEILQPDYTAKVWPILYTYEEIDWEALKNYQAVTETEDYIFYRKK
ncbi:MAG: hypothetical protein IKW28_05930, partial [Lachnospiraceae bacterium]|nr:hypothetical protein [Lachnospiraceae bacterium]